MKRNKHGVSKKGKEKRAGEKREGGSKRERTGSTFNRPVSID